MIDYRFTMYSEFGEKLVQVWNEWDKYDYSIRNWQDFLKTLPGVIDAGIDDGEMVLGFENESAFSMFLLRWG